MLAQTKKKKSDKTFIPMHIFHTNVRRPSYEAVVDKPLAELILSQFNTKNRPMSKTTIRNYADMMTQNQWIDGMADLVFGKCGNVLNGQQTLEGIVQSGKSVTCTIKTGYDDDAINVLDTQRGRTVADVLAIQGKNASKIGVRITSSITRLENNWKWRPTMPALVKNATKYQAGIRRISEIVNETVREPSLTRGGFLSAVTLYWYKNPTEAESFLRDLLDDNPANFIARKLTMKLWKSKGSHPGLFGPVGYGLTLEAIHLYHFGLPAPKALLVRKDWAF